MATTSTSPVTSPATSRGFLWFALILLVISVCINYIDRGNLSVAGSDVRHEMGLDQAQLGALYSAFFWTYALAQLASGWLLARFNVNWLYAAGYLLWSGATAVTGMATGFESLFAIRLILGLSESIAYPCYSKIIISGFPEEQRGIANSLIDAGSKLGPALGIIICGKLMLTYGWRNMFLIIGGVSMIWLIPWAWVAWKQKIAKSEHHTRESVGLGELLQQRNVWGTFIGLFCLNYTWYFLVTWLPTYLVEGRGFSKERMAVMASVPFFAIAATSALSGFIADRLIASGVSVTVSRKSFICSGLVLSGGLLYAASQAANSDTALYLIVAGCGALGMTSANHWAVTQTLAGRPAAATWTGFQNAFGNMAGVVAPWLTGYSVKVTGVYDTAFAIAGVIVVIGAASYLFVIGPLKQTHWRSTHP